MNGFSPKPRSFVSSSSAVAGARPQVRRRALLAALLPLILLGATSVTAFAHRIVLANAPDPTVGNLSRSEADWIAHRACVRLLGSEAGVVNASPQRAYTSNNTPVAEWNIQCRTDRGDYLIRINAQTFTVFAINRLSETPEIPSFLSGGASETEAVSDVRGLSRREAEARAHHYLRMAGVPAREMKRLTPTHVGNVARYGRWTFTYRKQIRGFGWRTLSVTVDGPDAHLENLWNPSGGI